jgi:hypothetical protein
VLPSLAARGIPAVVEYIWAAAAACLAVAAAWGLLSRTPGALPLARAAIIVSAVRELQRLAWTALPSNVIPGTRGWIAAAVCIASAAMLAVANRLASTR